MSPFTIGPDGCYIPDEMFAARPRLIFAREERCADKPGSGPWRFYIVLDLGDATGPSQDVTEAELLVAARNSENSGAVRMACADLLSGTISAIRVGSAQEFHEILQEVLGRPVEFERLPVV